MVERGVHELEEEVEGLQETLVEDMVEDVVEDVAEDVVYQQESLGSKRDAEETHVGTPTKKRKYAKATSGVEKELVVESSGGMASIDGVVLDENAEVETTDVLAASTVELNDSLSSNQEQGQSEELEQDAKKFSCDLCDKKFVSEQGRRTHKTRKHGNDQPLLLACEYQDCALAFIKNSELRKHEIAMHNRVPRSWKSKNIKKEPVAESVFEQNGIAEVVAGNAAEEESDFVVEDLAKDISATENVAECEDGANEGEPEKASITEAEDASIAEDTVDVEGVAEEENIAAKYQDVPADSDTSMDLADVVAVDQERREVI